MTMKIENCKCYYYYRMNVASAHPRALFKNRLFLDKVNLNVLIPYFPCCNGAHGSATGVHRSDDIGMIRCDTGVRGFDDIGVHRSDNNDNASTNACCETRTESEVIDLSDSFDSDLETDFQFLESTGVSAESNRMEPNRGITSNAVYFDGKHFAFENSIKLAGCVPFV